MNQIYFIRKMKVRLLSFAQYRILFNNSEALHTTMSIKTHLHMKATRLFSTQKIYNNGLNARYIYMNNTYNEVIMEKNDFINFDVLIHLWSG